MVATNEITLFFSREAAKPADDAVGFGAWGPSASLAVKESVDDSAFLCALCGEDSCDAVNYGVTVTYPQGSNEIPAGTTNYIYYDNQWQVIEVRTGGTSVSDVSTQIAWSAAYVNAAIVQDTYSNGVIQPNSRLYFLQDADWNTTAVVGYNPSTQAWGVVQRYVYDSYGNITILNADWSAAPSGTQPMVNTLYKGMQYDPITGLYYGRARRYSPSLGRWISQDPAGYVNGANEYQLEVSAPIAASDPFGLACCDAERAAYGKALAAENYWRHELVLAKQGYAAAQGVVGVYRQRVNDYTAEGKYYWSARPQQFADASHVRRQR